MKDIARATLIFFNFELAFYLIDATDWFYFEEFDFLTFLILRLF